jgi:hypothetical protein
MLVPACLVLEHRWLPQTDQFLLGGSFLMQQLADYTFHVSFLLFSFRFLLKYFMHDSCSRASTDTAAATAVLRTNTHAHAQKCIRAHAHAPAGLNAHRGYAAGKGVNGNMQIF